MLCPQMAWKVRAWVVASLGLLIVLLCWRFMIKPHEIKRLQHETAGAARQLRVTFSSQIKDNLAEIGAVFSRFELEADRVDAVVLDALDVQFKNNYGLESMMFSSLDSKGSIVLFNPHARQTAVLTSKEQCDTLMRDHPELIQTYKNMMVVPLEGSLCVYDSHVQMLAVLNLNTTLERNLQNEIMKGYFLALSDRITPEIASFDWDIPLLHEEFFQFFGEPWRIKIYPSKAYVEASIKRVFIVFCLTVGGFLGLFVLWFLKYRWEQIPLNSRYVNHLKRLALYDALTELPNRRHCLEYLTTILGRSNRGSDRFSVCFIDCDNFKKINDTYGHHAGDLVLKHLAGVVSGVIRRNDFFSRFAGDEFCLILDGTSSNEGIQTVLNKIFEAVSRPMYVEGHKIMISVSIGVAVYPDSGQSADLLLKYADEAMYLAKRQKKNNVYAIYPL